MNLTENGSPAPVAMRPRASSANLTRNHGTPAWQDQHVGEPKLHIDEDSLPGVDLAPWKERVIHGFAVAFLIYAVYYLSWRWTASLNPNAIWFSVALVIAETVTLLSTFFFVFNVWSPLRRRVRPAPRGLSVDVFVTTYNEPIEVIQKTAAGAAAIRYPHKTWLLDDGRREEVRRVAEELGIGYLTRKDNKHAKAGNLNNALRLTDGEFILQLDADHVPLPNMLDRLLGYFDDPKLAFVQSPQTFYNLDSFSCRYEPNRRRLFTEQSIFFRVIQPGKDRWNAAFFCGSCAVIRRAALDDLGGFSTNTVTEDFETSLRLHAAGWHSAYHGETLAYGLDPSTAAGFHTQRLRWAQGTMQVWRQYNPLTLPGLSLPQRICHFYSILVYLDGLPRIVFNLAPVVYLALGVLPIAAVGTEFIWRFIPIFVGSILLNALLGRGTAQPFWRLEQSNMTKAFTHSLGLLGYFSRTVIFKVTPKGRNRTPPILFAPHLALLGIAGGAVVWGSIAFKLGWIDYGSGFTHRLGFLVNVGWAAWNMTIAWAIVRTSIAANEERRDYRFPDRLHTTFTRADGSSESEGGARGVVADLNSSGMTVLSVLPIAEKSTWRFHLPLAGGPVTVRGRIVRREIEHQGDQRLFRYGVALGHVPAELRRKIDLHCTHDAIVFDRAQMIEIEDLLSLAPTAPEGRPVTMPAELHLHTDHDGLPIPAVLQRRGTWSAEFVSWAPIPCGVPVSFSVPDTGITARGRVSAVREVHTGLASRHIIEVDLNVAGLRRRSVTITPMMRKVAAMFILALSQVRRLGVVAGLLAGSLVASGLSAQSTVSGGLVVSGARIENDRSFLLAGGWVTLAQDGWSPVASVIGYRVRYPSWTGEQRSMEGLNPAGGLRHAWSSGDLQGTVGYAWQWNDEEEVRTVPGMPRVSSGLTTALQGNYWGDGAHTAQATLAYSWGGQGYLWTQARAAQRVAQLNEASIRLGLESSLEGSEGIDAWQMGPALDIGLGRQVLTFATGIRQLEPNTAAKENLWYARVDLVVLR